MKFYFLYLCLLAAGAQAQTRVWPDSPAFFMQPVYTNNAISGYTKLSVSTTDKTIQCEIMDEQLGDVLKTEFPGQLVNNVKVVRDGEQICVYDPGSMDVNIRFYTQGKSAPFRSYRQQRFPGYQQVIAVPGKGFACLNGSLLTWFGVRADSVVALPFPYRPLTRDSRLDIDILGDAGKVYFFRDELVCFDPETGHLQKQEIPKKDPRGHKIELYGMFPDPVTGQPFIAGGIYASPDGPPPLRHAQVTTIADDLKYSLDGVCTIDGNNGWQGHYTYWNLGPDTAFVPAMFRRNLEQHIIWAGSKIVKGKNLYSFEDPIVFTLDTAGRIIKKSNVKMVHKTTNGLVGMWRFNYQSMIPFTKNGEIYLLTNDQESQNWYSVSEEKMLPVADTTLKYQAADRENMLLIDHDPSNHTTRYTVQPIATLIP